MNAIENLALTKFKDTAARKEVAPGHYKGSATISVEYDLRIGEDYAQEVAQSVPWQRIAAIALAKLNGTTVEAIVREAIDKDAHEVDTTGVEKRAKVAVAELLGKKRRKVAGKVTGDVSASLVSGWIEQMEVA